MEAWFLADNTLKFNIEEPEKEENPSEILEQKFNTNSHVKIANKIIKRGFSIERSKENSPSAKRFLIKLDNLKTIHK